MIMNAEIARETRRSRAHTAITGSGREAFAAEGPALEAASFPWINAFGGDW
jgi:hypothetical protein